MATVTASYLGNLRVACTHERSGARLITDAPVDNHGKGEAFSPTDLCAAALGSCAMTIMGIVAERHGLDLTGARMEITKTMQADPRRIGALEIILHMPEQPYTEKDRNILECAAHTCPVLHSLHPDIEKRIQFIWPAS